MAANPFKTPEFKTLFQEWNERLRAEGHAEIEDFSLPEPALKRSHNLKWRFEGAPEKVEHGTRYYDLASDLLHWFCFQLPQHRLIWEMHCEGLSVRKIALRINEAKFNKTKVHDIIKLIELESGIRHG